MKSRAQVGKAGAFRSACPGYLSAVAVTDGFRIVQEGEFKLAEYTGSAGYGTAATASLIRNRASLLANDIQVARAFRLRTEDAIGSAPTAETIAEQFPHLAELCTLEEIRKHIGEDSPLTPREAALKILWGLFRTYSEDSVERMMRRCRVS